MCRVLISNVMLEIPEYQSNMFSCPNMKATKLPLPVTYHGKLIVFVDFTEFVAVEHGVTKEMVGNRADKKRLENAFDGKLEMLPIKRNLIHAELHDPHNLSPLTPSLQYSE